MGQNVDLIVIAAVRKSEQLPQERVQPWGVLGNENQSVLDLGDGPEAAPFVDHHERLFWPARPVLSEVA